MGTLKDIFVPCEIAKQLKEIGFDEPCIAYYDLTTMERGLIISLNEVVTHANFVRSSLLKISNVNGIDAKEVCSAPTYEQVIKWFRDKRLEGFVIPLDGHTYQWYIKDRFKGDVLNVYRSVEKDNIPDFDKTREQLILELIKIYKN